MHIQRQDMFNGQSGQIKLTCKEFLGHKWVGGDLPKHGTEENDSDMLSQGFLISEVASRRPKGNVALLTPPSLPAAHSSQLSPPQTEWIWDPGVPGYRMLTHIMSVCILLSRLSCEAGRRWYWYLDIIERVRANLELVTHSHQGSQSHMVDNSDIG